ncbi:MAG: beta-lactamase domain-containing protein [Bacillota bacterium]|nr:MAG: beta-lactamase domain-containing protein [Bacillota bacterium]MBS3949294.1 MBL fold metallo-hydrolase [Peptococcaceae bacterium]
MEVVTIRVGKLQTNCYLVINGDQASVIDPGGDAEDILTTLTNRELKLKQIVLTHGHADHTADAMVVRRNTLAEIIIHRADLPYLGAVDDQMAAYLGLNEPIEPQSFLQGANEIELAGLSFVVLSTPGHTPGSCCLYNESEGVLFAGDTLFASSIGRSDLEGGDPAELAASLNRLKQLPDETKVYPGHGPSTTIGRERVRNRYW